jgi:hypothetical protein
MRMLHVGLRVSDLERSLAFYRAVGYVVVGIVEGTPFGSLTMLKLPGDPFVTIELVHDPAKGTVDLGTGIISSSRSRHWMQPSPILPLRVLPPIRLPALATRTHRRPAGSPTRTAIESNWSSGRPATPTESPTRTSLSRRTRLADQPRLDRDLDLPSPPWPPVRPIALGPARSSAHRST